MIAKMAMNVTLLINIDEQNLLFCRSDEIQLPLLIVPSVHGHAASGQTFPVRCLLAEKRHRYVVLKPHVSKVSSENSWSTRTKVRVASRITGKTIYYKIKFVNYNKSWKSKVYGNMKIKIQSDKCRNSWKAKICNTERKLV